MARPIRLLMVAGKWHTATMCGRYLMTSPVEAMRQLFQFDQLPNIAPNYNVAPTQEMPIVRRKMGDRRRELVTARWGFIPHWADGPKMRYSTINARSEKAAKSPVYRDAFRKWRALVPADGYFEWKGEGKEKEPYLIRMKGGGLFAFAGLWSIWSSPKGEDILSYTIMTTEPNELMAEIHNRMPVILATDDHERWLDAGADPAEILKPCPSDWLEAYPVDKRVGHVKNNDAELIEPLR